MSKKLYTFPVSLQREAGLALAGTPVELTKQEIADLVERFGGKPYEGESVAPVPVTKPTGAALTKVIAEVIGLFEPSDEELWTKSGAASLSALEKRLGYDVSADEREAAMKLLAPKDAK